MQRGSFRGVHSSIWTMAGVGVAVVLGVVAVSTVRATLDHRAVTHIRAVAQRLADPVPLTPLKAHRDCNGDTVIRCGWTTEQDVDQLAARASAALTEAAHKQAQQECYTVRSLTGSTGTARECSVQIVDGEHSVSIFIQPFIRQATVAGASYSVYAG